MTDTRAAFEAHFQLSQRQAMRNTVGDYIDKSLQAMWVGWQAAMEQKAQQTDTAKPFYAAIVDAIENGTGMYQVNADGSTKHIPYRDMFTETGPCAVRDGTGLTGIDNLPCAQCDGTGRTDKRA